MVVSEEIITFNSVFFTKCSVSHRNVFKRWLPFWVTSPLPSCFATVDPKILPVQSIIRGNVCVTWPWYKANWALIDPIGRPREPGYDNGGSFILQTVSKEILNGQELHWIERSNRPFIQSDIFFSRPLVLLSGVPV